jgi:hypothetical protein
MKTVDELDNKIAMAKKTIANLRARIHKLESKNAKHPSPESVMIIDGYKKLIEIELDLIISYHAYKKANKLVSDWPPKILN